jgi:hypothetical protein
MLRALSKGAALGLLTALLLGSSTTGQAADDFKIEEGYTSLFNGKDLSGWKYLPMSKESLEGKTETPDKRFEVKDGIIVVNEKDSNGKGGIKDLFTIKEYNKAFNLRLEFRAAPKADSGVYLRSSGAQLQVRDYPTVGPYPKVKFNNGDWNMLDITVTGPVYTTTVNGKAVTPKDSLEVMVKDGKPTAKLNGQDVEIANIQVSAGDAALCKCNDEVVEKAMKVPFKGGIGLQAEVGKFEFRRIRIKEMP